MVACRDITSGESGCNVVTSSLLKSCSIKPFRAILTLPLLQLVTSQTSRKPLLLNRPIN